MKKAFATILMPLLLFVTVSANNNKVKILRLDKDLYTYLSSPKKQQDLLQKYPHLLPALAQTVTNSNKEILKSLESYFSHPELRSIYKSTIEQFDELSSFEKKLEDAIGITSKELEVNTIPKFTVHVSGFKENIIYVNHTISLSLDKYMGADWPVYRKYFSAEQIEQMKSQYITRDFIKAWLMADFIKTESTKGNLLQEIIEHGKLLYALKIILSNMDEKDLLGYTDHEQKQCLHIQSSLWNKFIKNNLYNKDKSYIDIFFDTNNNHAPNSPTLVNMPQNTGSWIGLQIVTKYANETQSTLKDIISTDEKTILKKSKYNPEN